MFFNLASLILGFFALCLPLIAVVFKKSHFDSIHWFVLAAFALCLLSVVFQLAETQRLLSIRDISAVMDTTRARLIAASILTILTTLLCGIALHKHK